MKKELLEFLQRKQECLPQQDYPKTSRVHALRSFGEAAYVKRDDELGFGITGTKFRKYRTLISHFLEIGVKEAVVIGGAFSNHILSLSQLLLENGIEPTLFLKGPSPAYVGGNFLFTKMLQGNQSIHWISKQKWGDVQQIALSYAQGKPHAIVIPEGAPLFSAFQGALTLPLDIIRNENELGFAFDNLFLDVGTGYSALAVLLAFAFVEKKTMCQLLLVAGKEDEFMATLSELHKEFEEWLGRKCPYPTHFCLIESSISPSFGSTNKALFEFIVDTARKEGFFLDPIYSAKLFFQAKEMLKRDLQLGKVLLIHSGGALSLAGFSEKLTQLI
jgi:1-aminocyclopropane-1-carboxylate deaminase